MTLLSPGRSSASRLEGRAGDSVAKRTGVTVSGVELGDAEEAGSAETTTSAWVVAMLRFTGRRVAKVGGGEGVLLLLLGGLSSMSWVLWARSSYSRPISAGVDLGGHSHDAEGGTPAGNHTTTHSSVTSILPSQF